MKKITESFLSLAESLDKELDESIDIFFKERPFLEDFSIEPSFKERTDEEIEEKITNEETIKKLAKRITSL